MSAPITRILSRALVEQVDRVSPNFVRITFGGEGLQGFGVDGALLDQRIKLIFPGESGKPAALPELGEDWYSAWSALPEEERGSMRTYSVREQREEPSGTKVVVDFVLHLAPGKTGPASRWASSTAPGDDRVVLLGPRKGGEWGGIEYEPGDAEQILLAGDETAAPAIARILEDIDRDSRGIAFIEVPEEGDALAIDAPAGVEVRWLARGAAAHGTVLIPAVLGYLDDVVNAVEIHDVDSEELVWETPRYSGLGEELGESGNHSDRYFWIAGESGVVTTLRRHLVKDLGVNRAQVAFMGYWRIGVAMKG